jgi:hypothetical protein
VITRIIKTDSIIGTSENRKEAENLRKILSALQQRELGTPANKNCACLRTSSHSHSAMLELANGFRSETENKNCSRNNAKRDWSFKGCAAGNAPSVDSNEAMQMFERDGS